MTTRPLFTLELQTTPHDVGHLPQGFSRVVHLIFGGSFTGERLSGQAIAGGGDWSMRRDDGVVHMDVRAALVTDAGGIIVMTYGGRLRISEEARVRLAGGEALGVDNIYSRMLVQFETAAPDLLWLNDIVAVGLGERWPTGPVYHVHEIL